MQLVGSTAIVTGGARGVGYSAADLLMAHGAAVVIADSDYRGAADACIALRGKYDRIAIPVKCDVTVADDVRRMVEAAAERLGPISLLVNNAGGGSSLQTTRSLTEEEWERVVALNLKSAYLCTRAMIAHMVNHQIQGSIINVTSINATVPTEGLAHYGAAKAGVGQFTRVVANEVARMGIRVNAVAPGLTRTRLTARVLADGNEQRLVRQIPMGRIGEPEDVARVILFLASDLALWVTGVTLAADGGQHLRGLEYLNTIGW